MLVPVITNIGKVPKLSNGRHLLSGNVQIYIYNGKKHREKGPAEIHPNGYKVWYKHGIKHRTEGPAVENPVNKYREYWENGKFIRRESL